MTTQVPRKVYTATVDPIDFEAAHEHIVDNGGSIIEKHSRRGLLTFRASDNELQCIAKMPVLGKPQEV